MQTLQMQRSFYSRNKSYNEILFWETQMAKKHSERISNQIRTSEPIFTD